jgi:hypothetical protein
MTREQIIKNLEYLIQFLPGKSIYAEKTLTCAITALRGPIFDPETGRVPCGCGGKAVFEGSFLDEEVPSSYGVSLSCIECGISTIAYKYEQEAMKAWNTAMGWKGGAE